LADSREARSLDNLDFTFNPNTNRAQIYELATGHFVAQRRDVLLVGPPDVGKSQLLQAIAREVISRALAAAAALLGVWRGKRSLRPLY
jgi:DNA replication protein DnaC